MSVCEKVIVDTNVLIDCMRGLDEAVAFIRAIKTRMILSAMTIAELYAGIKGAEEERAIETLLSLRPIVPVTADIAKAAGLLKREFGKSHGVGIADAILAATALAENARLATLNVKHYPMMHGLKPAYVKK